VLVGLVHHTHRLGILCAEVLVGIVGSLLLVDVVLQAGESEVIHIVVVAARLERFSPRFQQLLYRWGSFVDGRDVLG